MNEHLEKSRNKLPHAYAIKYLLQQIENTTKVICLPNISHTNFKKLLIFLYSINIQL